MGKTVEVGRIIKPSQLSPYMQGLVIAGIADMFRPADKLSKRQSTALAATGIKLRSSQDVSHTLLHIVYYDYSRPLNRFGVLIAWFDGAVLLMSTAASYTDISLW